MYTALIMLLFAIPWWLTMLTTLSMLISHMEILFCVMSVQACCLSFYVRFWKFVFVAFIYIYIIPWWNFKDSLGWLRGYSVCPQCGRSGFNPWVRKIPWRRKWQPTPIFLPEESHGRRSLVGYSLWGHKESDTTEQLHFSYTHTHTRYLSHLSDFHLSSPYLCFVYLLS